MCNNQHAILLISKLFTSWYGKIDFLHNLKYDYVNIKKQGLVIQNLAMPCANEIFFFKMHCIQKMLLFFAAR